MLFMKTTKTTFGLGLKPMKVNCEFGYFRFYPRSAEELVRIQKLYEIKLVRKENYFTFPALAELPDYTVIGRPFGLGLATKTLETKNPGKLLRENKYVYSLPAEDVVPILSIVTTLPIINGGEYAVLSKILGQPGAFVPSGLRLVSYEGLIDLKSHRIQIYDFETWPAA